MKRSGKHFVISLAMATVLLVVVTSASAQVLGTVADRMTVDDYIPTGHASWIRIEIRGGIEAIGLDDNFDGMVMRVDLNTDGNISIVSFYDLYNVYGGTDDIVTSRPGENGANDFYFYVRIKRPDPVNTTPYPDGIGYNTDLIPQIQLTNSGQLRVMETTGWNYIQAESGLAPVRDGIVPSIRQAFIYDDGTGSMGAVTGVHARNDSAYDGYVDRIELFWSEPMRTSNDTTYKAMFSGLGTSIYATQANGVWDTSNNQRFSFWVVSSRVNTGMAPRQVTYNAPAMEPHRFREADTSQRRYYAQTHVFLLSDRAGPVIIAANTQRAWRRQPLAAALDSAQVRVIFSEPIIWSSVSPIDFSVMIDGSVNNIVRIVYPPAPIRPDSIYVFKLMYRFNDEHATGMIALSEAKVIRDKNGWLSGISSDPWVPITDGIFPNILLIRTVDADLTVAEQLDNGGPQPKRWGYIDYMDVIFDHSMDTTKKNISAFAVSGKGIRDVDYSKSGKWLSTDTLRVPLKGTTEKIPNTDVVPEVSFVNPMGTIGLRDRVNGGYCEDLLVVDYVVVDGAGPAIIVSYTAGKRRMRIEFSEQVNTSGWPTKASPALPDRFKWYVGAVRWNMGAGIYFNFSGSTNVVYLNHNGLQEWTKDDSGAVNFRLPSKVRDKVGNWNQQWDDDTSLDGDTPMLAGSDVRIHKDDVPPNLLALETCDLNLNGRLDHYRFVFDPLSPPYPVRSFNPTNWNIWGYEDKLKYDLYVDLRVYDPRDPYYDPLAINAFGDTVRVYVHFNEISEADLASKPYAGDTGFVPLVNVLDGKGFADWAENIMAGLPLFRTIETDAAGIALVRAMTISPIELLVYASEQADNATVETTDFWLGLGLNMGTNATIAKVVQTQPGLFYLAVFDQFHWPPDQTGWIRFIAQNTTYDMVGNGNQQVQPIPIVDGAASQFRITAVPKDTVKRDVPFQIEVLALDSRGAIDIHFQRGLKFSVYLPAGLSHNLVEVPCCTQWLHNGKGYFNITSRVITDSLRIIVTVDADGYDRFTGESDPIVVIEPTIDTPDTVLVRDFPRDQGSFVSLAWPFSQNHPGLGNQPEISYYQLFYDVDHDIYQDDRIIRAFDPATTGQDSMRIKVEMPDNQIHYFWVIAVFDPVTLSNDKVIDLTGPDAVVKLSAQNSRLIRSQGIKVFQRSSDRVKVEAAAGNPVTSGAAMGYGRAIDNIEPTAPADIRARKEGLQVLLHWPKVTHGSNGVPERFPVQYSIYSHETKAFFDPESEGTLVATISDTSFLFNSDQLRAYFCVLAVDSDNKSGISKRVGKYGFDIISNDKPVYNYLSVPLASTGLAKAADLSAACKGIEVLLKYSVATNGYSRYYLPQIKYGENFDLNIGSPVMVAVNDNAPEKWFMAGNVPDAHSIQFTLNKSESKTLYTELTVPLDKSEITTADQLAQDIGNVNMVLKLDPESNGFSTFWLPGINYGENFAIEPGEPVLISVKGSASNVWPNYSVMNGALEQGPSSN